MSRFPAVMRLKERAEEDVYFARRDRELVEALRSKRLTRGSGPGKPARRGGE